MSVLLATDGLPYKSFTNKEANIKNQFSLILIKLKTTVKMTLTFAFVDRPAPTL